MLLILSSGYISEDMQLEIGRLPPTMVPVGGKRLIELQIESMYEEDIYLTLPNTYELDIYEYRFCQEKQIKILRMDENEALGEVLYKALQQIKKLGSIKVLFGDTLIINGDINPGEIGISNAIGFYSWSIYDRRQNSISENRFDDKSNLIFNGVFAIDSAKTLSIALKLKNNDLKETINFLLQKKELKAKNIVGWLDFGHLHTFFKSRRSFLETRSFNTLKYDGDFIIKESENHSKIIAELNWFKNIPELLKLNAPIATSADETCSYKVEYLNHLTLSEIYKHGRISSFMWEIIIDDCFQFLDKAKKTGIVEQSGNWNLKRKSEARLAEIPLKTRVALRDLLLSKKSGFTELLGSVDKYLKGHDQHYCVIHGDFCFSNILFDFRAKRIKVIDPRGYDFDGKLSIVGPHYYDITKLAHSCIGRYDDIVAERYDRIEFSNSYELLFKETEKSLLVQKLFLTQLKKRGIPVKSIYASMVHLFISMIPLHSENLMRQKAFLMNALRLSREMESM